MPDVIHIAQLELSARIGVPDAERTAPQRLTAEITLVPFRDFRALGDRLGNAVDYSRVCLAVQQLCRAQSRSLIETLAEEIATMLLADFAVQVVELELRKYILPDTAFVAVRIRREREPVTGAPAAS